MEAEGSCLYEGVRLGASGADRIDTIPRVTLSDTEAASFYYSYVTRRLPCVLQGHPPLTRPGTEARPSKRQRVGPALAWRWTNVDLEKLAGDRNVAVEIDASHKGRFGRGTANRMSVSEFLRELSAGKEELYLSTQPWDQGAGIRPPLCGSPARELLEAGWAPIRPQIMGHLVPARCV